MAIQSKRNAVLVAEPAAKVNVVETTPTDKVENTGADDLAPADLKPKPVPVDPDPILWFKKIGKGSFEFNRHYIKENQTFQARRSELPKGLANAIIEVDGPRGGVPLPYQQPVSVKTVKPAQHKIDKPKPVYTMKERENEIGVFDIFDARGKKMNEKGLDEKIAKEILKGYI